MHKLIDSIHALKDINVHILSIYSIVGFVKKKFVYSVHLQGYGGVVIWKSNILFAHDKMTCRSLKENMSLWKIQKMETLMANMSNLYQGLVSLIFTYVFCFFLFLTVPNIAERT